jgi:L-asparaginase
MQTDSGLVVIVGTGGTIAGATTGAAIGHSNYVAGSLSVASLIAAVPALQNQRLETEQLANVDSCDMDYALWHALNRSLSYHLQRPEVMGAVVTHGTDTLEETAYWLHRTLSANKPVVLTAAMRPATALSADGPQNLLDAVTLARHRGAQGVLAVMQQKVYAGADLRKLHGYRLDAFESGDAGLVALCQDGQIRQLRPWPMQELHPASARLPALSVDSAWPAVDMVWSHAGADGKLLTAAVAAGARGIVIAGTGNATVHKNILQAAQRVRAQRPDIRIVRSSRCIGGGVFAHTRTTMTDTDSLADQVAPLLLGKAHLTPQQARIELMLDLM